MAMVTESERKSMIIVMENINTLIRDQDWNGLNSYIKEYDLSTASPVEMAALVRSSYPVRIKLIDWWNVVADVAPRLDKRLLHGIID